MSEQEQEPKAQKRQQQQKQSQKRGWGEGQIIPRGSDPNKPDRYLVRIPLPPGPDGKRQYHNKTIKGSKTKAREYLATELAKIHQGDFIKPSEMTLGAHLSYWIEEKMKTAGLSERYIADIEEVTQRYIVNPDPKTRKVFGKPAKDILHRSMKLCDIEPEHIQNLYSALQKPGVTIRGAGLSSRTIRMLSVFIKKALRQAVIDKKLKANPAEYASPPKRQRLEMKALNEEEADRFWAAADADPMGIVFLFAVISGMRPEEFLGLRWSDLDLNREQPDGTLRSVARVKQVLCWRRKKGGGWYIDETKTSQSRREISLPQVLVDRLLKHKQEQKPAQPQFEHLDLVFRTEAGGPLHSDNLGARDLRRILKAAGLPYTDPKTGVRGLRLYDLRHSCATLLLAEGKHAKVVADRLGHTSVAMTLDVYSHVTRRLEDEVAESFDRKFNKPNEKRRSGS